MKKRLILYILALSVLACMALPVGAAEVSGSTQAPTEAVRAPDQCGEDLTWAFADGTLTITGSGAMDDFAEGAAPWQAHKDAITEVVLSGGVTYIGAQAFRNFDGLTTVDFGDSLYEIGTEAFRSCGGLTSISLPASFKIFGEASFLSCENLKQIHCSGRFPSFRQNCLWDTYATIYFPAERPWSVESIEQLETAFQGRIEFLASDGSDPYAPAEAETEPEETEPAATEPEITEPETVPPTTVPAAQTAEPEPATQTPTASRPEDPTMATQPVAGGEDPDSPGGMIGLVVVLLVLCLLALGALVFLPKNNRKGKYSSRRRR